MRVALLGNGYLATAFSATTKHTVTTYSKPNIDFLQPSSLEKYYKDLIQHDVILNTIGTHKGTTQNIIQVNFTTPVVLVESLIDHNYAGKIIMVGSHGSTWTSWPGIEQTRLVYNTSKLSLKNYLFAMSHSELCKASITLVDCTKFKTPNTNNTGNNIQSVATLLEQSIDSDLRLLHLETY